VAEDASYALPLHAEGVRAHGVPAGTVSPAGTVHGCAGSASYMAELDDFEAERTEALKEQGAGVPYSFG
jgi:hypothetical protein